MMAQVSKHYRELEEYLITSGGSNKGLSTERLDAWNNGKKLFDGLCVADKLEADLDKAMSNTKG
jgi:hypothetical protein